MVITLFGIITDAKEEQSLKAFSSMFVTVLGIVTAAKVEQFSKADSPTPMMVNVLSLYSTVDGISKILGISDVRPTISQVMSSNEITSYSK